MKLSNLLTSKPNKNPCYNAKMTSNNKHKTWKMWVHSKPKADKNNKNCKAPNFKAWGIAFFLTFDLFQPTREVQKCWVSCALLVIRKYQAAIIMHALSHKTEKKQKKTRMQLAQVITQFIIVIISKQDT